MKTKRVRIAVAINTDKETLYPCATKECKAMRTKEEGGTTFTVCDDCWDKLYPPIPEPVESVVVEGEVRE